MAVDNPHMQGRTSLRNRARKAKLDRNTVNQLAADFADSMHRPPSRVDKDAYQLGIWSPEFHYLTRAERKRLVSVALSQRPAA